MNGHLETYLNFYINNYNCKHAVLINGKWGSGKTHFIKQKINLWKKDEIAIGKNGLQLKPIYVSLYGVSSINEINQKIRAVLNPLLHSKPVSLLKNLISGSLKIKIDGNENNIDESELSIDVDSISLLKGKKVQGNKILVFDDLERCNLDINNLFGYINNFVEHHNCKVILVADEEKLIKKETSEININPYSDFKEKLIGQTFTFKPNAQEILERLVPEIEDSYTSITFQKTSNIIADIFEASEIDNLRLLKQGIVDFERFVSFFEKSIKKHPKFEEYLQHLSVHFIIVYLEFKSGNKYIDAIPSLAAKYDKIQEARQQYDSKYYHTIEIHKIKSFFYIIEYSFITFFINNGYIQKEKLSKYLNTNPFLQSELKDWEKLWHWEKLEDNEYNTLIKKVSNEFYSQNEKNPFILTHMASIFISLSKNKIIQIPLKDIVKEYKTQINNITLGDNTTPFRFPDDDSSWGKVYREKESIEFSEIFEYFKQKVDKYNKNIKDDYLQNLFQNINNDNIFDLQKKLVTFIPSQEKYYSTLPLFENVDGKKLGNKLLLLTNNNITFFTQFIYKRYSQKNIQNWGFVSEITYSEKNCIKSLCEFMEKHKNSLPIIKQYKVKVLINLLNEILVYLNSPKK